MPKRKFGDRLWETTSGGLGDHIVALPSYVFIAIVDAIVFFIIIYVLFGSVMSVKLTQARIKEFSTYAMWFILAELAIGLLGVTLSLIRLAAHKIVRIEASDDLNTAQAEEEKAPLTPEREEEAAAEEALRWKYRYRQFHMLLRFMAYPIIFGLIFSCAQSDAKYQEQELANFNQEIVHKMAEHGYEPGRAWENELEFVRGSDVAHIQYREDEYGAFITGAAFEYNLNDGEALSPYYSEIKSIMNQNMTKYASPINSLIQAYKQTGATQQLRDEDNGQNAKCIFTVSDSYDETADFWLRISVEKILYM